MKRFGIGLLWAIAAYAGAAFAGYWLIVWFSSNTHDRSLEAAMTAMFAFGPLGAVVGFILGFVCAGRPRQPE